MVGLACGLGGEVAAQAPKAPKAPKGAKKAKVEAKIDLGPVIAALWGGSNEAAAKAAETLGTSADPAAHEALLDALAIGMPASVAVAAINALATHPAPPDVTALARYAAHHNPQVRSSAYGALAMYPAPEAKKRIIRGLHDMNGSVRGAAAMAAAKGRVREATGPLFELLARSEDSASRALAAMADVDLARKIGDQFGKVPDPILAQTLGAILRRPDFGPDAARVEIVRAIGKIQDTAAISALTDYLDATPKNPPRESRQEAQKMVEARLGGGK